jgi:septal ring factor EnvC (AmiA/AmiB activator)
LSPSPSTAKISGIEKAVVLRGEDFPTLQAALPPQPVAPQQRQKEMRQKQQEKQQEIKDQQRCLQQLSEQQQSLKTEVATASLFDGECVSFQA